MRILILSFLLYSCNANNQHLKEKSSQLENIDFSAQSYYVKNGSFFQDTIVLKRMEEKDSSKTDITILQFSTDTIYLTRKTSNLWDGKGMLGYNRCHYSKQGDTLKMSFTSPHSVLRMKSGVDMHFIHSSSWGNEISFVKIKKEVIRNNSTIRSDIQLR